MSAEIRDSNAYTVLVQTLPEPTEEQAREFARFVTGAHSWYKHLARTTDAPVVFFLDPNAGRDRVHVSPGESTYVDRTDESRRFHYTWMTTEAYRRRFGHWTYHADRAPGFGYRGKDGMVDTTGLGRGILSVRAGVLDVPEELVRAGTAMVNALMFRRHFSAREEMPEAALSPLFQEQRMRQLFPREMSIRGPSPRGRATREPGSGAPPHLKPLVEALRPLFALRADPTYLQEYEDAWRELHELHRNAMARGGFDRDEDQRLYLRAQEAWEGTSSRREERVLLGPVMAALDREHERQMGEMVAAMNRFIGALRAAPGQPTHLH